MNDSNRNTWIVGIAVAGIALMFLCACFVIFAFIFGVRSFSSVGSSPPIAVAVTPLPVEEAFAEPNTATPVVVEVTPTTEENAGNANNNNQDGVATPVIFPTATFAPRPTNLDEVDSTVLREVWDFVQTTFDGPLPTQGELEETVTQCSVDTATGNIEFDPNAEREPLRSFPSDQERPTDLDDLNLTNYYETWTNLQETYNGALPTQEELRQLTIACSIRSLGDPFTRYISPEAAAREAEDLGGSFQGIGAFVRLNDDNLAEIVRPMDGQPAEEAGVRAGDIVIGIDGENVIGQTLDEIISKIRGPQGTLVVLTVRREGSPDLDIEIIRANIEIPLVTAQMLDNNIAYIHLSSFSRNAETQILQAMDELLPQNPTGLIFDLRDNPGGFLDQSVAVSDLFLTENIVLIERDSFGEEQIFRADDGDPAEAIRLVVLINAGSASASEIVAGAIRDNNRAVLIGETTFGKGSVQIPHNLSDGGQVNVTIARWYLPSNTTIDTIGVSPDIEVLTPTEPFDLRGEGDVQLERAVEYILTGQ
jgi:carboxyl-terminal processing protease